MEHSNDNFDYERIKMFKVRKINEIKEEIHQKHLSHINESIRVIKHIVTYDEMAAIDKMADLFEYLYDLMESKNYNEYYSLVHSSLSNVIVNSPF